MTELQCRAENGKRYIDGLIVPWGERAMIGGREEVFEPGGLRVSEGEVIPFRYGHPLQGAANSMPVPIGVLSRALDTEQGLWTEWAMLDSPSAHDAWQAAEAGAVGGLSAEFVSPRANTADSAKRGQGAIRADNPAVLVAGSLVERPQYRGAKVAEVRANLRQRTPRRDELERYLDWLRHKQAHETLNA